MSFFPYLVFCKRRTKWFLLLALLVQSGPLLHAAIGKLGAMGDSLTDEYWDSDVASYATNWAQQLAAFRDIDMGPTAGEFGTNTWGSPRNLGFKHNWALSGADTESLLSQGQHTGLRDQFFSDGVSNAVLAIGSNDFNPTTWAFFNIYNGLWSSSHIQSYVNESVSYIETALTTVKASGAFVVLANVFDPGLTPAVTSVYTTASKRDRVAAAVEKVNAGLKNVAQKYQVPLMDWYGLERAILGSNTNLRATLKVGNVTMNLRKSDPGPPNSSPTNGFVSDGFHPNTVMQGIFANVVLQAFNSSRDSGFTLFSEAEILSHARISYGGADNLLTNIGSYTNYIILPMRPKFTAIVPSTTNVILRFTTVSNQIYIVDWRDDLIAGQWTILTNNMPATGAILSVTNQVSAALPKRFYRVRQLP